MNINLSSCLEELEKLALDTSGVQQPPGEEHMRALVTLRPWVTSAAKGALPAASLAALLPTNPNVANLTKQEDILKAQVNAMKRKSKYVAAAGAIGALAGVTDRYIKQWAATHPRGEVAKRLTKQLATERGEFDKTGAFAGDLRRLGLGFVREPPFPTEDSKRYAALILNRAKRAAEFTTHTMRKHVDKPGPSIKQVAAAPRKR